MFQLFLVQQSNSNSLLNKFHHDGKQKDRSDSMKAGKHGHYGATKGKV